MKLPTIVLSKKRAYVIVLVLILALSVALSLMYSRFSSTKFIEAEAPSETVILPSGPSIKSASDLQSAHDTLNKLNTINNDYQKEEDQLKQLANELQ